MKPSGQAVEEWAKSVASKDKRPLPENSLKHLKLEDFGIR